MKRTIDPAAKTSEKRKQENTGTGMECGERGEWRNDILWGVSIPGNVLKHFWECPKTFLGMSLNIPGNVAKHSGECRDTFWGIPPNIPGSVLKHFGKCRQTNFNS